MSVVMYPELRNRRDFVHDCWIIAKHSENEELKLAISADQYFFLKVMDCSDERPTIKIITLIECELRNVFT